MSNNFTRKINRLKRKEAEKDIDKQIKSITKDGMIALGEGYLLYLKKIHPLFDARWNELDDDHQFAITEMLKRVPDIAHHLNEILWENRNPKGDELSEGKWFVETKHAELLLMLALPREDEEVVLIDQEVYKQKIYGLDGNALN